MYNYTTIRVPFCVLALGFGLWALGFGLVTFLHSNGSIAAATTTPHGVSTKKCCGFGRAFIP